MKCPWLAQHEHQNMPKTKRTAKLKGPQDTLWRTGIYHALEGQKQYNSESERLTAIPEWDKVSGKIHWKDAKQKNALMLTEPCLQDVACSPDSATKKLETHGKYCPKHTETVIS